MDNTYVEKLVSKKMTTTTAMIRVATIVACVIAIYVLSFYLGIYGLVAMFVCGYLIYYVFSVTSVEYEYVLVKNELTIDGIYGKNKRKTLQQIDVSKCEVIAPVESTYAAGYHRNTEMKSFDYTSGTGEEQVFLLLISFGAAPAKVYIEVDDRLLEGLRMAAPGKLKMS